eukprot:jgi/Hompol1/5017/HPOL_004092-RA
MVKGCFLDGSVVGKTLEEVIGLCQQACDVLETLFKDDMDAGASGAASGGVQARQKQRDNELNVASLESIAKQFESRASFLFQVFSGAESVQASLGQLLIRLDFNKAGSLAASAPQPRDRALSR